jgi:hypothetical protein
MKPVTVQFSAGNSHGKFVAEGEKKKKRSAMNILSVIRRLYVQYSTVRLRVLSLIVIPQGKYPINQSIKSRTH